MFEHRGRDFVIADVNKWAVSELRRLGYKTEGVPMSGIPIVFAESFDSSTLIELKDSNDYQVTFNYDIVSRSEVKDEVYSIAAKIMAELDFTAGNFTVQTFNFVNLATLEESDDLGMIQRQIIQLNLKITKQWKIM